MKRALTALGAAIALASLLPTSASAQDEWLRIVRQQIQVAAATVEEEGFEMTHEVLTGSLNDDAAANVTLELAIGVEYMIFGACDQDCSDLDLTIYDAAGNQIDSDLELDDVPIVTVTPARTGTYSIRVAMATCSVEPCRYGIGAFGR